MTRRNRWLRAVPWIGLVAVSVGLGMALIRLSAADAEIGSLRGWQSAMLGQIAAAAARDPDGRAVPVAPDAAGDALARIVAARDGAMAMIVAGPHAAIVPVGAGTIPPPPAATAEISRLNQTQSTGSAAGDARIIEQDSRAAWTGWK